MAKDGKFVVSPCEYAGDKKDVKKGGKGVYDETPGYPGRTKSKDGAPEKFYETAPGSNAFSSASTLEKE